MDINKKSKKKKGTQRWTCRYCGIAREPEEMTTVPKNRKTVYRWSQILGREFFENVKIFRTNSICMRHFADKRRVRFELPVRDASCHKNDENNNPVTMEEVDQVEKLTGRILEENLNIEQTCQLCGVISDEILMKRLRGNSKWIRILDVQFTKDSPMYVCRTHSAYKLTKKMDGKNRRKTKKKENLFLIDSEEQKPEI